MKVEYHQGDLHLIPETEFEAKFLESEMGVEKPVGLHWQGDSSSPMGIFGVIELSDAEDQVYIDE